MTEINSKNKPVVLDTFELPPPLAADAADSAVIKKLPRPDTDTSPPLKELITSEQYETLLQLALTYKQTLSHDPMQQVDLGEWV